MTTLAMHTMPIVAPTLSRWSRLRLATIGGVIRHWQNVITAFAQVWANKSRSCLTTVGIIIAVTSTITVVSFVQGFGNYVTDIIRGFGTNLIFVFPYSPSGFKDILLGRVTLDVADVRAVESRCD